MKKDKETESTFHDRLMEVLKTEKKKWWEKNLHVSNSLISSRWEKGGMPQLDKIINICKLKNVSANWLLLGAGAKYLDDIAYGDADEADRRALQEYIIKLERKVNRFDALSKTTAEKESALEAMVRIVRILESSDDIAVAYDALEKVSFETFFDRYVLPMQIFAKSFGDVLFKVAEVCLRSEAGKAFLLRALEWVRAEQEKGRYMYKGRLKELDALFQSDEFQGLFKSVDTPSE